MVITRVKSGSPDMILKASDMKFYEKKDGIPPGACRPSRKLKNNYVEKVDPQKVKNKKTMSIKRVPRPPARPPARARGPGGAAPSGKRKTRMYIYMQDAYK